MRHSKFFAALVMALLVCLLIPAIASAATVSMAQSDGALYLRTGPGTSYEAKGTVHNGDHISVQENGSVWSRVRTDDGRTGYIKNVYIKDGDTRYATGTQYFDSSRTVYVKESVHLRAGASTSTKIITTLSKGTKLTALGKNGTFLLVKTSKGTEGYVSASYLSKNKPDSGEKSKSSSSTKSAIGTTKTIKKENVVLRAGAGHTYGVVAILSKGTKVKVVEAGEDWTCVRYQNALGWVQNKYLK